MIAAVARLSWTEAARTGLPALAVAAAAAAVAVVVGADAVDAESRRRLAVSAVATIALAAAAGTAPLVLAVQMRRDLDQRAALTLFSRPLDRGAYLLGRWLGAVAAGLAAALAAALAGGIALHAVHGAHALERPQEAAAWAAVGLDGGVTDLAGRPRHPLSGPAGSALRWSFPDARGSERVALRLRVTGQFGRPTARIRVQAVVGSQRIPLAVAPESTIPATGEPHEALIISRGPEHDDLRRDRLRLVLVPAALDPAGGLTVEVVRAEDGPAFTGDPGSCTVLRPGGPALGSLALAALAGVAAAAAGAAMAAWLVPAGGVGVAILGAGTLLLAGSLVGVLDDASRDRGLALPLRRLIQLAAWAAPDLGRTGQGADLASGRAVTPAAVATAWLAVLPATAALLGGAWWTWRRREL
ncbi:MAG: hypothetical protein RLZZ127_1196 [Planctomycetota bacterium]|jgi:hypothetical protein